MERGRTYPRWDTVEAIASALNASVVELARLAENLRSDRSDCGALGGARIWQRLQDARRKAGARVPDLDCDQAVGSAIVIAKAPGNALADDIVGLPGREPGDIGNLSRSKQTLLCLGSASAGYLLEIEPPDRNDSLTHLAGLHRGPRESHRLSVPPPYAHSPAEMARSQHAPQALPSGAGRTRTFDRRIMSRAGTRL
jgi:hypothetical protein